LPPHDAEPRALTRIVRTTVAALEEKVLGTRISEEDIKDRSKADGLTKALALFQSGWLTLQCIARTAHGLTITELELVTMAFVFCAVIAYALWWHKPFDVERKVVLVCSRSDFDKISSEIRLPWATWLATAPGPQQRVSEFGTKRDRHGFIEFCSWLVDVVFIERSDLEAKVFVWLNSAFGITATIFSAIHLAAWDWDFPSPAVKIMWRTFGVIAVGSAISPLFLSAVGDWMGTSNWGMMGDIVNYVIYSIILLSGIVYIPARIGLLVLTFYSFTRMPASTYEPLDWTGVLPHFS